MGVITSDKSDACTESEIAPTLFSIAAEERRLNKQMNLDGGLRRVASDGSHLHVALIGLLRSRYRIRTNSACKNSKKYNRSLVILMGSATLNTVWTLMFPRLH